MCGIAGWLGNMRDSELYVCPVTKALRHRGPDSQGFRSWTDGTLIHTRLSIIDLSAAGAQPMGNEDELSGLFSTARSTTIVSCGLD